MIPRFKQIISSEKGQALPIVLILLALGGLAIVPSLNYAATGLNSSQNIERNMKGLYAAEAGVENALWCLGNSILPPEQLPETINQMNVSIQTENFGIYTLYLSEMVELEHHAYLDVYGEMVWDEGAEAYKYIITIEYRPEAGGTIHLDEVGVRLPIGYGYQTGSSALFTENLSVYNPDVVVDALGSNMLNWVLEDGPKIDDDDPVKTQTFYVTGQGNQEGDYTWVLAGSSSIGLIGQYSGYLYKITATATIPENSEVAAIVTADVMIWIEADTADILAWQISK